MASLTIPRPSVNGNGCTPCATEAALLSQGFKPGMPPGTTLDTLCDVTAQAAELVCPGCKVQGLMAAKPYQKGRRLAVVARCLLPGCTGCEQL